MLSSLFSNPNNYCVAVGLRISATKQVNLQLFTFFATHNEILSNLPISPHLPISPLRLALKIPTINRCSDLKEDNLMKGFGYSREKSLIAKAIKTHSVAAVDKQIAQFERSISAKQMASLLFEVIETLPADDISWAYANLLPQESVQEMQQEAVTLLYKLLTERGFEPGRDFSTSDRGIRMSLPASEALLEDLPPEFRGNFDALLESGVIVIQEVSPIDELEKQLGVPFVENLLQRIEHRLPNLTDGEACSYLYNIFEGVEARTGISMVDLVSSRLRKNKRLGKLFQMLENGEFEENSDWMVDLVCAAGGEAEFPLDLEEAGDPILSRQAMELLDKVYVAERPVASLLEAAEMIEQLEEG